MKTRRPHCAKVRLILTSILITAGSPGFAEEIGPECRGVAAGVVAAMKSSGEITSQEASQAAIVAARRACTAAMEGQLGDTATRKSSSETKTAAKKEEEDDTSMWDFLTRDRKTKDGHDRLRRLKTQ